MFGAGSMSSAYASSSNTSILGGTTTDNTSAGNENGGGLPQIQQQGNVSFVSGGVGQDESNALQQAQNQWPLSLRFTGPGADFLSEVKVKINDAHGAEILNATADGPYMLVRLLPGRYTVHAAYKGHDQSRVITIPAKGNAKSVFRWTIQ
ncbi:carboxypeptidase regulatory-like domain-containing protein [Paraburkholderia bonniea]|nr:carboxypeptidase regulatory-like domain-containing protein [Paraburkholderia bonniea]WJF91447.1 carboxypeptidase regulatory-like domain-containing protein [Paraburkholderia bonniea]WJF94766.1 carboxypeptidase regulatory-like domain-containing protein [Paraburkholderia bonniea]